LSITETVHSRAKHTTKNRKPNTKVLHTPFPQLSAFEPNLFSVLLRLQPSRSTHSFTSNAKTVAWPLTGIIAS